MNFVTEQGETE